MRRMLRPTRRKSRVQVHSKQANQTCSQLHLSTILVVRPHSGVGLREEGGVVTIHYQIAILFTIRTHVSASSLSAPISHDFVRGKLTNSPSPLLSKVRAPIALTYARHCWMVAQHVQGVGLKCKAPEMSCAFAGVPSHSCSRSKGGQDPVTVNPLPGSRAMVHNR